MAKKTILYVEGNQDGTTGGSHYCLLNLIEKLNKDIFSPVVIFYEDNRFVEKIREAGAKLIVYRRPKGLVWAQVRSEKLRVRYSVLRLPLKTAQKCVNLLRVEIIPFFFSLYVLLKFKINIVHLNNSVHFGVNWAIAGKLLGKKVVAHHRVHFNKPSMASKINCHLLTHVFCVSHAVKKDVLALGMPQEKCSVVYDAVDSNLYSQTGGNGEEIRHEFHIHENQILIVIVGNLKRWKGQLVLVEALGLLPESARNVRCLIVGDSSCVTRDDVEYFKEIKGRIEALRLAERVILTGYRPDVAAILASCNIFVHASIDPEPYGLVVLEAMRAGKAIVASDHGGPSEMIEDGVSGVLIPSNQPSVLAKKIKMLIENKLLRDSLGANAMKRFEDNFACFDMDPVEKIYNSLPEKAN